MNGDHRGCTTSACVVAARWHDELRKAARQADAPYAVVSTIHNRVDVVSTSSSIDQARDQRRSYALNDTEYMTMVYIVRACDGAFL